MPPRASGQDQDLYFSIYASELRLIAGNSAAWGDTETGGTLFGMLSHGRRPVVVLVTPPCPNATHERLHFADDPEEFQRRAIQLSEWGGLQVVGTDHSHHDLHLCEPSGGDTREVQSITSGNGYDVWIEIITTHEHIDDTSEHGWLWPFSGKRPNGRREGFSVRINAFFYPNPEDGHPVRCPIKVIPGVSPYRQALMNSGVLSEEALGLEYLGFPLNRIRYEALNGNQREGTCESEVPETILAQIRDLPEAARESLELTAAEELIIVTFLVCRGFRAQVAFDRDTQEVPRAVYLLAKDATHPKDITKGVRSWKDGPTLNAIHRRLAQSLASTSPECDLAQVSPERLRVASHGRARITDSHRAITRANQSEERDVEQ